MLTAFTTYLIFLTLGLLLYFPVSRFLEKFDARGYAYVKIVAGIVFGYIFFISKIVGIVYIGFIVFLILYIYYLYKNKDELSLLVRHNIKKILYYEALFIVIFFLALIYRSINPKIEGIEKFMDFAIIMSLSKSQTFPFIDVWYAGKSLNYYYFGQLIPASIINVFNLSPIYFYNTYFAHLFAICFIGFLSIGKTITNKYRYGFLIGAFVLLAGNLDLILNKLQLQPAYFYAQARSLIPFAITEFPSYSFIISDLHAHVLNIANVVLLLSLCLNIYLKNKIYLRDNVILGFLLGLMYVTNSWDFLIYSPIVIFVIFSVTHKKRLLKSLYMIFVTYLSAIIFYAPFLLFFNPAVGGVGFKFNFDLGAIFNMFGAFLFMSMPYLLFYLLKIRKKLDFNLINALLITYGIILIFVPEFLFLKDIYFYANPDYYRANTVFKFWYQAWIILSLSSVFSIYLLNKYSNKFFKYIYLTFSSILIVAILIYPINSINYIYKTNREESFKTLDGSFFMNKELLSEKQAVVWINENIKNQVIILEKPGESYTTDSIFSTFTGNPTIIGWINHEYGWRNNWEEIAVILADIETIYTSTDQTLVENLTEKYDIEYAIIGNKEKEKYGLDAGLIIEKIGTLVYENNSVKIIKVN